MSDKRFKSLDDLCSLLVDERKLTCRDRDELKRFLSRTNYYRFSGYAREFQIDPRYGDNRFVSGASFEEIREIAEIDSRMRALLLEQLSVVEIAVRAMLAHEYGRDYGESAFYLNADFYKDGNDATKDKPLEIVNGILSDLERDKGPMVSRYINGTVTGCALSSRCSRYAEVPIWVAVEAISFGRVTNFVSYVKDMEPAKRATSFFGIQWAPFAEVLHSLCVLRNLCAHHRQLWNRRMSIQCPVQKKLRPRNVKFDAASPYAQLLMVNSYRERIDGDTGLAARIDSLINENARYAEGFLLPNPK